MIPIRAQEFRTNLANALAVVRQDQTAIDRFATTRKAIIQSFWPAILLFPIYMLEAQSQISALIPNAPMMRVYIDAVLVYVILWLLFPLAMVPISRNLGCFDKWPRFVVVNNWASLPIPVLVFALRALGWLSLMPSGFLGLLIIIANFYVILLTWFVLRHCFEITGGRAATLTFLSMAMAACVELFYLRATGMDLALLEQASQGFGGS